MQNQEDKLQQEILSDARRKTKRVVERAERDAEKLVKAALRRQERAKQARLREAEHTADGESRAIRASIEFERTRHWLIAREEELDALFTAAVEGLDCDALPDADRAESLKQLLTEALSATAPGALSIEVRPADRHLLTEQLLADVKTALDADAAGVTISVMEREGLGAGVVVRSDDGRKCFDNTYATRLSRMKAVLRATVSCDDVIAERGTDNEDK